MTELKKNHNQIMEINIYKQLDSDKIIEIKWDDIGMNRKCNVR
jgi:hypothetical protein